MLKKGSKILKLVKDGQIGLNWFTVGRNSQKLSTVARKWSKMQKLIITVKRSNMVPYDPKRSNIIQKGLNGRNSKMFKNASLNPTCLPGRTKDTKYEVKRPKGPQPRIRGSEGPEISSFQYGAELS